MKKGKGRRNNVRDAERHRRGDRQKDRRDSGERKVHHSFIVLPPLLTWVLPPQFVSLTVTRRNRSVSADPAPLGDDVIQPLVGDSVQYRCPITRSSGTFTAPHMFATATPAQVFAASLQRLLQKAG